MAWRPDGSRYSALEREPYAWVHATLRRDHHGHRRFGTPLSPADVERLWVDWSTSGGWSGIREGDLPPSWDGYLAYRDQMIAERLEPSDVVDDVLVTLAKPLAPGAPAGRLGVEGLCGCRSRAPSGWRRSASCPLRFAAKLGMSWSRGQELELRAIGAASRGTGPLFPQRLRCWGPEYLELRRRAIGRGELAEAAPAIPAPA